MARDVLYLRPLAGRLILAVSAGVYFLACFPLFGRRGFPEVDPFWLAMVWLWVPGVFISAAFDRWCKRRVGDLVLYGLVAGFTVSWSVVIAVPSQKTALGALLGVPFYGPLLAGGVFVIEAFSRALLVGVRRLVPTLECEHCEYLLRGLTEPRCPDCGASFSRALLNPRNLSGSGIWRRWTTLVIVVAVLLTAAFAPFYRWATFRSAAIQGRKLAEEEWASGDAKWFVTWAEIDGMTPQQAYRFVELDHERDPTTDLEIRMMWPDWKSRVWQSAYRRVIEQKLRDSGVDPPKFD